MINNIKMFSKTFCLTFILLTSPLMTCPYGNEIVCGSDNKTYENLCKLNKSTAVLQHKGECVFRQANDGSSTLEANCGMEFQPVCGVDGVTYGNDCRRIFRSIKLAYPGPCGVEGYNPEIFKNKTCECSYEWHPICTRNSFVNFENKCFVRCIHQLEGSHDACAAPCKCSTEYDPVCSLNGITYDNECQLNCAAETMGQRGECQSILFDCEEGCSRTFAPICGEDGRTHRNTCFAKCNNIKIMNQGLCEKDSKDPALIKESLLRSNTNSNASLIAALCQRCSREIRIAPVCSSDGITYESECQCQCQSDGVCDKYADGPCPSQDYNSGASYCNSQCSAQAIDPVCGTNYKTYDNLCMLQCNQAILFKSGQCNSNAPVKTSYDARTSAFQDKLKRYVVTLFCIYFWGEIICGYYKFKIIFCLNWDHEKL